MKIDIHCDLGEHNGNGIERDRELMKWISSANIACGFHAGNPATMSETILLAKASNVSVGAHPSFNDREGFGRRNVKTTGQEVYDIVLHQVNTLAAVAKSHEVKLHHVKPHGALYNMAARDATLAGAIARAVRDFDIGLIIYGLSGTELIVQAQKVGLLTKQEGFMDRTYQSDGTLTPRTETNALIRDTDIAVNQVIRMIRDREVVATNGVVLKIHVDTVCIHGDGQNAVEFAREVNQKLKGAGIEITSS